MWTRPSTQTSNVASTEPYACPPSFFKYCTVYPALTWMWMLMRRLYGWRMTYTCISTSTTCNCLLCTVNLHTSCVLTCISMGWRKSPLRLYHCPISQPSEKQQFFLDCFLCLYEPCHIKCQRCFVLLSDRFQMTIFHCCKFDPLIWTTIRLVRQHASRFGCNKNSTKPAPFD